LRTFFTAQHGNGFAASGQCALGNQVALGDKEWSAVTSLNHTYEASLAEAKRIKPRVVQIGDC
jgi:hypothetical protein